MNTAPRLRPMSIGDMFDAAFRLYRQHFLTFVGIVGLLQVPMAIVQFAIQVIFGNRALAEWMRFASRPPVARPGQNPFELLPFDDLMTIIALSLAVGAIQYLLVYNLITGALANAISRSYMGQPVSILSAYGFGLRRYLSLIGASILTFLMGVVLLGLIFGCSFGGTALLLTGANNRTGPAMAVVLVLLLMGLFVLMALAALFFYARLLMTTQAIVLEDQGPLGGISRSWRLTGSAFWRTLGIMLLMGVLVYLIAVLPATVVSFALTLTSAGAIDELVRNQALTTLLTHLGQLVALPLQFAVYTLLYYDLRVRKEGYDLELMAGQATSA